MDSARQLIDQAVAAIQSGNHKQALEYLDEAVQLEPESAEIYSLRGIAFANTRRGEAATESFRKATMFEPSARSFYNLAVHLLNMGDKREALQSVEESLKLEPDHAEAQKLLEKLAGKPAPTKFNIRDKFIDVAPVAPREGYERLRHVFPFLRHNQGPWKALGWTIIGIAILSVILFKVWPPVQAPAKLDQHDTFMGFRPLQTPFAAFEIALFVMMILCSTIWTSMDLIDRRGRALWMVPTMICCFLFLPFIPQAIYMGLGRRDTGSM